MSLTIVGRAQIGVPAPPSHRLKLRDRRHVLCHQVGVGPPQTYRYRSERYDEVLRDARSIAAFGASSGRTYEYNYLIGLDGTVFEQAGEYIAAHCKNFNEESVGILMIRATDIPSSSRQRESWHELIDWLVARDVIDPQHERAPHYRYRYTGCCGLDADPPGKRYVESPTGEGSHGLLIPELRSRPIPPPTEETLPMDFVLICPAANVLVHMGGGITMAGTYVDANGARAIASTLGVPVLERPDNQLFEDLRVKALINMGYDIRTGQPLPQS